MSSRPLCNTCNEYVGLMGCQCKKPNFGGKPKKGSLHVDWTHVEGCPGNLSILSPEWCRRRELCICGMPSNWELDVMHEQATEMWKNRVESGEADP